MEPRPSQTRGKVARLHARRVRDADAHRCWGPGDFTETDSPVGDSIGGHPTTFDTSGWINVYHVEIPSYDPVHFDAFDRVHSTNQVKYVFRFLFSAGAWV